ncbi:MAG: YciI family protein [Pseudomonadota bacterium]
MEYVMLIYNAEERWNALSEAEEARIMAGHFAINEKAQADGTFRSGNRLMDVAAATTVRNNDGKITVTDGPFAETKEQLGGYYIFEADDLDTIIGYASLLPHDDIGCVEIRPLYPETE